ncbi:MAG TPA: hypothetical protein PK468_16440 [Candidatus Hydrogenedentes bacterium]|nr:hypothetical protein [Candidatus Hydrogenedentota bacterium]
MPETPFEFYVDNAVIVARIDMPDVDTKFLIVYGEYSEFETVVDVRFAITKILLQETHVIET